MYRYKHFLIVVSIAVSVGMHAGDTFQIKRRKTGEDDSKRLIVLQTTPEKRPMSLSAYIPLQPRYKGMRQGHLFPKNVIELNAARLKKEKLTQEEEEYNRDMQLIGKILLQKNKTDKTLEIHVMQIKPAYHLIMAFLRPAVLSQKNHNYVPAGGDLLLPVQSLFDE